MKSVNIAFVTAASLSLALCGSSALAFAEESIDQEPNRNASSAASEPEEEGRASDAGVSDGLPESTYDKSDFYSGEAEVPVLASLMLCSASVVPCEVSQDMLYFDAFEGGTYDRTFDYGDGYHAMGYYQFDHRYGLKEFVVACYNYNPEKYSMFAQFTDVSDVQFKSEGAIRSGGAFTALGNSLIAAWQEAYAVDGEEFSRLQDGWAYESYYMPAERYLASRGIDISTRSDAVKGLCWGLSNLFGQSGWRKFVGGVSDGYDWNGVYHYVGEGYEWPGCGLHDDMTDAEFVTALCNYVVDNVAVFYAGQPEYHQGWQNRYVRELEQCLAIIERTGDTHDQPQTDTPPAEEGSGDSSGEGGNNSDVEVPGEDFEADDGPNVDSGDVSGQSDGTSHEDGIIAGGDADGSEGDASVDDGSQSGSSQDEGVQDGGSVDGEEGSAGEDVQPDGGSTGEDVQPDGGSIGEDSQSGDGSVGEQGDATGEGVAGPSSPESGDGSNNEGSIGQQPETGESDEPVVDAGADVDPSDAAQPSADATFEQSRVRSEIAKTNDNGGVLAGIAAAVSALVCTVGATAYRMMQRCR